MHRITARIRKIKPIHIPLTIIVLAGIVAVLWIVVILLRRDSLAADGNMYYTPEKLVAKKDASLTFLIRITPGTAIDTVTSTITYDPNKLTYTSVNYTDSPFSTQIPAMVKTGSVTIQSAKFGGSTIANDSLIAAVQFTSKTDGAQTIGLTGNAARAGIATNPTVMGKVVTIAADTTCKDTPNCNNEDASNSGDAADSSSSNNPILKPISALLTKLGMSNSQAQKSSLPILVLLLVLAITVVAGIIMYKHHKRANIPKVQENPGHEETTL